MRDGVCNPVANVWREALSLEQAKCYGWGTMPHPAQEKHMELSAVLTPAPEGGYVAFNPETGTTTQGETVEEAIANLREATELYLSEFPIPAPGHPLVTTLSIPVRA